MSIKQFVWKTATPMSVNRLPLYSWAGLDLSQSVLERLEPVELMDLLADLSPEVSIGLWQTLRLVNPGCSLAVVRGKRPHGPASRAVAAFLEKSQAATNQTLDGFINSCVVSLFLRGAVLSELVIKDGEPAYLASYDPVLVSWMQREDGLWKMGQTIGGRWSEITTPLVSWTALDPSPGSPFGRAIVSPAVFMALFLISILFDLKRVVQQQGWPRQDISLDLEKIQRSMPADVAVDPARFVEWVQGVVAQVEAAYSSLEPDQVWVHTDDSKINEPAGTLADAQLGALDGIIKTLERMVARGVKMLPTLIGTTQSRTETQAVVEWEVIEGGIRALRHIAVDHVRKHLAQVVSILVPSTGVTIDISFPSLNSATRQRSIATLSAELDLLTKARSIGMGDEALLTQWEDKLRNVLVGII